MLKRSRSAHPMAAVAILILSSGMGLAQAGDPPSRRDEMVKIVERVQTSVVNIHSERTVAPSKYDPFSTASVQPQRVNGMGTGIVIDSRGYIVTNYHVVDDIQSLRVRLVDGSSCAAKVFALDKDSDLAIIKIDPPTPLPTVPLGTADDLLLAEQVFAIGNAYGYEHTVTVGRVSAMKRDVTLNKEISYKSLIQTQAPINPGNSGGPLFNQLGEVVGVNVAIRAGAQNIAFAIPVDTMIAEAAAMLRRQTRVSTGLTLRDNHSRSGDDNALSRWISVVSVETGSSAAAAGFQPGDIIEQVGPMSISTTIDWEEQLLDRPSQLMVQIRRSSSQSQSVVLNLNAKVAASTMNTTQAVWSKLGVMVSPVAREAVTVADPALRGGLLIREIGNNTPAAQSGLQKGDVLIGLHLWETLTLDNVLFVLNHEERARFSPMKLYYLRNSKMQETQLK